MPQKNGGKIKMLEETADIVIGDPCKKDQPDGAISYKWIEDSIANGVAQLEDRYVIQNSKAHSSNAGKGGKSTRTKFTPTEDAILVKYALGHKDTKGNRIWQKFEKTVSLPSQLNIRIGDQEV